LVPVEDPASRRRLIAMLKSYTRDNVQGRVLHKDGSYERLRPTEPNHAHQHQEYLYELACQAEKQREQSQRTVFEPHRASGKEE
jgi:polyphosphate kinase